MKNIICLFKNIFLVTLLSTYMSQSKAQYTLQGKIIDMHQKPVECASIYLEPALQNTISNNEGKYVFSNLSKGNYKIHIAALGYLKMEREIKINKDTAIIFTLQESPTFTKEVVVSGSMYPVSKTESPIPIEVYQHNFFQGNPSNNLFEALQNVNGIRPQVNCNVCGTGNIRINGLEGPYTMVLIDGMPIVSGLATVYGLSGIPTSLIERVEIVRGAGSTLYGSEAVAGVINVITKNPDTSPKYSIEAFSSTWQDANMDIGINKKITNHTCNLFSLNYFHHQRIHDKNKDNFTDIPLQHRIALVDKITFQNKTHEEVFTLLGRYIYEDRWGGQTQWHKQLRGTDSIYGESIYTRRAELIGNLYIPHLKNKVKLQFSSTYHYQNSAYGTVLFIARQDIHFVQLVYQNRFKKHFLTTGACYRHTFYDDNTWATQKDRNSFLLNAPILTYLPGIFIQDEYKRNLRHTLLIGIRYDFHHQHKHIISPRVAYKWTSVNKKHTIRAHTGNGFRVVNIFMEEHAALTGSRVLVIDPQLKPEISWTAQTQYTYKNYLQDRHFFTFDINAFYTYFTNKIIPDYSNPDKIIYDNLQGYAVSRGINTAFNIVLDNGFSSNLGFTLLDVYSIRNQQKQRPLLTESYSTVWSIRYQHNKYGFTVDYTGNLYGPMKMPLLGPLDSRPLYSPIWTLQNVQFSKEWEIIKGHVELFVGIKNLLNYVPPVYSITRPHDPFDKNVIFDAEGNVVPTPDNPQAYTFDTSYVFASNQGRRFFFGLRYIW